LVRTRVTCPLRSTGITPLLHYFRAVRPWDSASVLSPSWLLPLVASPFASVSPVPTFRLTASLASSGPSRPEEFHPEPLTDPDVNLSIHPARATHWRLPPSIKRRSSSGCPLTPVMWVTCFLCSTGITRFLATTKQCAPDQCIGTFGLVGRPLVPFPFSSPTRFSSSVRKPE